MVVLELALVAASLQGCLVGVSVGPRPNAAPISGLLLTERQHKAPQPMVACSSLRSSLSGRVFSTWRFPSQPRRACWTPQRRLPNPCSL